MATKPTDPVASWGEGASIIVSPGIGKQDVGWEYNEEPPPGIMNWWKRISARWLAYLETFTDEHEAILGTELGPLRAFLNLDRRLTTPWETGLIKIVYIASEDRWFATQVNTPSGVYDSADGETWSAKVVTAGTTTVTRVVEQGGNLYFATGNFIYESTTGLASGFTLIATSPFSNIARCTGLEFDATNGLWIACGYDLGLAGHIETATTLTGPWTTRVTVSSPATFSQLAIDQNTGNSVVSSPVGTGVQTSSDAINWVFNGSPTAPIDRLVWNDSLGSFAAAQNDSALLVSEDGTGSWSFPSLFTNVHNFIETPDGVVVVSASPDGRMSLIRRHRAGSIAHHFDVSELGVVSSTADNDTVQFNSEFIMAPRKWALAYDATYSLAISEF